MRRRLAVGFSLIILAGAGYTLPPEKKGDRGGRGRKREGDNAETDEDGNGVSHTK